MLQARQGEFKSSKAKLGQNRWKSTGFLSVGLKQRDAVKVGLVILHLFYLLVVLARSHFRSTSSRVECRSDMCFQDELIYRQIRNAWLPIRLGYAMIAR